jgi:hypothetical protein
MGEVAVAIISSAPRLKRYLIKAVAHDTIMEQIEPGAVPI